MKKNADKTDSLERKRGFLGIFFHNNCLPERSRRIAIIIDNQSNNRDKKRDFNFVIENVLFLIRCNFTFS